MDPWAPAGHRLGQDAGRQDLLPSLWLPKLSMPDRQVYKSPTLLKKVISDNLAWLHMKHTTCYPGSSFSDTEPVLSDQ